MLDQIPEPDQTQDQTRALMVLMLDQVELMEPMEQPQELGLKEKEPLLQKLELEERPLPLRLEPELIKLMEPMGLELEVAGEDVVATEVVLEVMEQELEQERVQTEPEKERELEKEQVLELEPELKLVPEMVLEQELAQYLTRKRD